MRRRIRLNENEIAEAKHILQTRHGSYSEAEDLISRQLDIIINRSTSLMTLATVVLTITGFSGPTISSVSIFATITLGLGLVLTLFSLAFVLLGSFKVAWSTQFAVFVDKRKNSTTTTTTSTSPSSSTTTSTTTTVVSTSITTVDSANIVELSELKTKETEQEQEEQTIAEMIAFRDSKQRMSTIELLLLFIGLGFYVLAFIDYIIEKQVEINSQG